MGIGASLFLMAAGAVMAFAIQVDNPEGVNINTIGWILMIVGAIGALVSLLVASRAGGRDRVVEREL